MRRGWIAGGALVLTVAAGVGVVGWSWTRSRDVDRALDQLEDSVDAGHPGPALAIADSLPPPETMTASQRQRQDAAIERLVTVAVAGHPPILTVGTEPFDPARTGPYRSGAEAVKVAIEIRPRELGSWLTSVTVGPRTVTLGPQDTRTEVSVGLGDGGIMQFAAHLGVRRTQGAPVNVAIPGSPLRVVRDLTAPRVAVALRGRTGRMLPAGAGLVHEELVPPSSRAKVTVVDDLGLKRVTYAIGDGTPVDLELDRGVSAATLPLPDRIWSVEDRASVALSIVGENRIGNVSETTVNLLVRGLRWNPIVALEVGVRKLSHDNPDYALLKGPEVTLAATLEPGVPANLLSLSASTGGRRYPFRPEKNGTPGSVVARVQLPSEVQTGITLWRNESALRTYKVRADNTPPTIRVPGAVGSAELAVLEANPAESSFPVEVLDTGSAATLEVEGTRVIRRAQRENGLHVDLAWPPERPAKVVLDARDAAGHKTRLHLEVR